MSDPLEDGLVQGAYLYLTNSRNAWRAKVEVTREEYVMIKTLLIIEELRDHGAIEGGFNVNREESQKLVDDFESAGNSIMSNEEMVSAATFLFEEAKK